MPFQKIANRPNVIPALRGAFEKGRLPHALLFQGPVNSGQREAAVELAKICFCENKKELAPCGSCAHCRQVNQNTHPDFFVLALGDEARELKVEAIRDLIAKANYKPFSACAKIFVIDQADRMNEIAQNAFLKTLEEPPGRTVFVLISSSPQQLLATIRSRVQTLHFG
ncbi:MAG: DNA polymerase III subunit delta', partial [Candidatus Omnitrophica bacterium CG07_land_8_20_14_0_80_50_8]